MGRRTGCDFYWLGGHFEMPEFPETGQLSKFFGKFYMYYSFYLELVLLNVNISLFKF